MHLVKKKKKSKILGGGRQAGSVKTRRESYLDLGALMPVPVVLQPGFTVVYRDKHDYHFHTWSSLGFL
jgi:hypothetical protein